MFFSSHFFIGAKMARSAVNLASVQPLGCMTLAGREADGGFLRHEGTPKMDGL